MRFLVLGAGLQGSACAYDLLQDKNVEEVRLADMHIQHPPEFLHGYAPPRLIPTPLDVHDHEAVLALMRQADAVMCALPFYLNLEMTRLAVDAGTHYSDLGGNTEIVFEQQDLDAAARSKGVSVIPDCGLAPGMVNILAEHGIQQLDSVKSVRMYVGGLPQDPEPPLNYNIVYSLEGVLDYYTTLSWVLRDGKRTQVPALSELETIKFPKPLGALEAFHTSGGLSTMAFRHEGRIPTMEYKTLRYPGHARVMEAIRELGFLDSHPVDVKGVRVTPRDLAVTVMGPRLRRPEVRDLVVLRVTVEGKQKGRKKTVGWELIDYFDDKHKISAMMRATGFSLAITGLMQARGQITQHGVRTPDECVPAEPYIAELAKRGVKIRPLKS
jgi:lysine 6-dehydrogenase